MYTMNVANNNVLLPVDIVLSPSWWYKNTGITFDRDFFFHPLRRVEVERKIEKELFERWGKYGMGGDKDEDRPEVGPIHLAAGYLLSEMLGCKVLYSENKPPQVQPLHKETLDLDMESPFKSKAFKAFTGMMEKLKKKYGRLTGDVDWNGILNIAIDLHGEEIFMDMYDNPNVVKNYFNKISRVMERFISGIQAETGTSSISVNRTVRHFKKPVFLHSECSHTMIPVEKYEEFLMPFDIDWSCRIRPFGIHYCGSDPHRYAESFSRIPGLDFLDVGWGGDIKILREYLPRTFLNIRLSPVEIVNKTPEQIRSDIRKLVADSGNPYLTGVCCINMDDQVGNEKIDSIFETVEELRK